jgi:elongation factor P
MIIVHAGDLFRVTAVHHLTPGNKRGFMQTKMKNLRTGIGTEYKFRSEDRVDQAILDNRQMQYLYAEGDMHTFMDTENYEQLALSASDIGDLLAFLLPNSIVGIEFHDGKPGRHQSAVDGGFGSRRYRTVDEGRHLRARRISRRS